MNSSAPDAPKRDATQAREFLALHAGPEILKLPTAWDALSAKVFENEGAQAIGTSSAAVAWSRGYGDGERIPFARFVVLARDIARATRLPLSVDIEMGLAADLPALHENVLALLGEGVSGINIEDGAAEPEALCRKIETVRSAATSAGHQLFINARCDVFYRPALARQPHPETEALKRANAYKEAGADGIFLPGLVDPDTIESLTALITLPVNLMVAKGLPNGAELKRLGVRRISAGAGLAVVAYEAARAAYAGFARDGDSAAVVAAYTGALNYQRLLTA